MKSSLLTGITVAGRTGTASLDPHRPSSGLCFAISLKRGAYGTTT